MALEISSLPPEVLKDVLRFLNTHHKFVASLVCRKWLDIINCYRLLCDVKVQFELNDVKEGIELFNRMSQNFGFFLFYRIIIDDSVLEFLKKYSHQFVILYFIECMTINYEKYEFIFPGNILHCDRLKTLKVANCDALALFASFPNVTELKVHLSSDLSDSIICQLNKSVFKLKKLTLGSNNECDDELYDTVYENEETIRTDPSNLVLSFASIKVMLENHRNTLTSFDFSELQLSPDAVQAISDIIGLKLRSVRFPVTLEPSNTIRFCENHGSLTSLDLSFLYEQTNETVRTVCHCLLNLQELVIKTNSSIDNGVIEIFQLEQLKKLDLAFSEGISELSYREAMSNSKTFKLKYLNLNGAKISDESLFELLKRNRKIRYLNISRTNASDKTLNMICKNLILLEELHLTACYEISDAGLTGEHEPCSNAFPPTPFTNLKKLKILYMWNTPLVTVPGLLKSIRFPSLEFLLHEEWNDTAVRHQLQEHNPCLFNLV